MPEKPRIVFMGTPEFAVPSLAILVAAGYDIVAVITAPDRPAGRGRKLQQSAVKTYALSQGLNILQPDKLKSPDFLEKYHALKPDLNIVVAFRMLPEIVWNFPPLGTFNLHASLLPQYRGAAPINWAVINGEKETGITTFFINQQIDTGNIILQEKTSIGEQETAGELHDRLMEKGAELVLKTVKTIENKGVHLTDQSQVIENQKIILKDAPKLYKETAAVQWSSPLAAIYNLIRGLSPYPAAFITVTDGNGEQTPVKVYRARAEYFENPEKPGTVTTDGKTFIALHHPQGALYPEDLQVPGRKRLDVDEFLRGFPLLTAGWHINLQEQ